MFLYSAQRNFYSPLINLNQMKAINVPSNGVTLALTRFLWPNSGKKIIQTLCAVYYITALKKILTAISASVWLF